MRSPTLVFVAVSSLLAGGAVLPAATEAQTTASTIPVGYQQITVAAAADSATPTNTVISVPFYNAAAFAAAITSVDSASAVSTSSATFITNGYAAVATPFLLHMQTGASAGRYFLITANTTTQLTVAPRGYDLTTILSVGDTYEIVPANTLAGLFGSNAATFAFQTGASASQADNIQLWNSTQWAVYYNNGTNWKQSGNLNNQNNAIIYPDEGLYITRRATSPLTLTFVGTVPSSTERSDLLGPGSTFISNRFPTGTTLNAVGFQNLPNWLSGTTASQSDNVYLWTGTTWGVYYYNGTNWKQSGSLLNVNTQAIPSGTAAFVIRQSSASGISSTLAQSLPYSLSN